MLNHKKRLNYFLNQENTEENNNVYAALNITNRIPIRIVSISGSPVRYPLIIVIKFSITTLLSKTSKE